MPPINELLSTIEHRTARKSPSRNQELLTKSIVNNALKTGNPVNIQNIVMNTPKRGLKLNYHSNFRSSSKFDPSLSQMSKPQIGVHEIMRKVEAKRIDSAN